MMKSVTIKDKKRKLLIKVIYKKNGEYELIQTSELANLVDIDVRDNNNCKVNFKVKEN